MAGGMALRGLLPVVHSFACFLSARPNEQIYNNATEKTRVIYVGSLAGVVPGGPGHSHQAVRDISALAAIPGLTLVEPSCEAEVGLLLDWCIREAPGGSYLRLISIPCKLSYQLPAGYRPRRGQGVTLVDGRDAVVITYGPVLLGAAVDAARILLEEKGTSVKVINLPWLNYVDAAWLREAIGPCRAVHCLDNHYVAGGQGDLVARSVAAWGAGIAVHIHGLQDVPPTGTNPQVLNACGLDASSLVSRVLLTK